MAYVIFSNVSSMNTVFSSYTWCLLSFSNIFLTFALELSSNDSYNMTSNYAYKYFKVPQMVTGFTYSPVVNVDRREYLSSDVINYK